MESQVGAKRGPSTKKAKAERKRVTQKNTVVIQPGFSAVAPI